MKKNEKKKKEKAEKFLFPTIKSPDFRCDLGDVYKKIRRIPRQDGRIYYKPNQK
jgi:hypothetical protein